MKRRVLIVEDDEVFLRPLRRALELGDFEGASAALRGVTPDPEIESMWLRTRSTLLGPWLAELRGPGWFDRFALAWR